MSEPPVDVLHLRACNFVGGPERQLLRYAGYERNGKVRVALATFVDHREGEGEALITAARAQDLEILELPGGGARDLAGLHRLIAFLRQRRVRLLCTHAYRADLLGLWAARRCGIPVAWFLRGWTGENAKIRLFERLDRALLGRADCLVCLSHLQQQRVVGLGLEASRIEVVPNAVEAQGGSREEARARLRQRLGTAADALLVGVAGRLSPEKGAADLLRALALLPTLPQAVEFLIFGEGPERRRLEEMIRELGLTRARLAGFHADFPALAAGLDLLVNPSHREEMPNVVMEAMAAGVAVIATEVGGVAEIAGAPPALRLVPVGDPARMARALAALLTDDAARRALAASGQLRILHAFSPQRQCERLRELYARLIPGLG